MKTKQQGLTLIEVMIVAAILGILASISFPAYQNFIKASRRAEAQALLHDLQQRQEKHRINNTSYADAITTISGASSNDYYIFSISSASSTTYTLTATAKNGTSQSRDTGCTTLTLDQNGGHGTNANCWKK